MVKADVNIFLPDKIKVKAGEKLMITLDNIGQSEHDFEIINLEADSIETLSTQQHNHKNNNQIHIHSLPGEKQAITFVPLTPGEYRFICTIPGHAESDMFGSIEVTL
ncbi:cupredoxin domain-containing protein [Ureibacillus chungkukjangi]|uniref:cupredoxin domain-containing protein n=1 Tax=Ureibacillus chungkukjangi TaxID=1202712 RepID=UPI00203D78E6|nr:cupredoxin domain-containing protein [Ureibacillus chungkukjangi]